MIAIVKRPGRPRIYCNRSCRQRAYERRRGLGVLPPPDRNIMRKFPPLKHLPSDAPGYERGLAYGVGSKGHAMRPAGISEPGDRRLTLCGLLARPVPRRFVAWDRNSCETCAEVERIRPSARPVRVSPDLAALRSLLDQAAIDVSRASGAGAGAAAGGHPLKSPRQILRELLDAA